MTSTPTKKAGLSGREMAKVAWRPNAGPQTLLVTCPVQDVFYGGARGGGKSAGLLMDFAVHAHKYGKYALGLVVRQSYPEFEELERQAMEFYGPLGWRWTESKRLWKAPNGAALKLRYLETVQDVTAYQGHSYTWVGVDEAGNWPKPDAIDLLTATLRSAHGVPCVFRMTGNPGGVGHVWIRNRYIKPSPPGVPFVSETGRKSVFIPSKLDDNPYLLNSGYETQIRAATFGNEALWKAWRDGDWDVIAGAAFPSWNRAKHTMPDRPHHPPWTMVAGLDWGYAKGAAVLGAFTNGRLEIVDAVELKRLTARDAGQMLGKRWEQVNLKWLAYSPDMDAQSGVGISLFDEFAAGWAAARGKMPPMMAGLQRQGSRYAKFVLTQQALAWDDKTDPYLKMWEQGAHYLIETVPALPVDPKDPNDVDTDADDHGYDALGFILAVLKPPIKDPTPPERNPNQSNVSWNSGYPKPADTANRPYTVPRWNMPRKHQTQTMEC